jgi:hypothetical protein
MTPGAHVLHITLGFSAEPALSAELGPAVQVAERPLAAALAGPDDPDLVWVSDATPADVEATRHRFPRAGVLATLPVRATPDAVVVLLASGADLVLRDEGVLLAAAALQALSRRPARLVAG